MNKYESIVEGSMSIAQAELVNRKNNELHPIHLLWGLLKNPSSYSFKGLNKYTKEIKQILSDLPTVKNKVDLDQLKTSPKFSEWLTLSSSHSIQAGRQEITESDLLRFLPQIFPELDINYEELNIGNENETEVPKFLINLNELAKNGKLDPVIGRSSEIRSVMEILGRRGKNNPVLVGSAGVGKTAIVEGLAEAIVKGKVPEVLEGKTVLSLEMGALMAGTKYRGEFEERIQKLISYIKEQSGEVILFIDEIHQLVGAGRTDGAMDAANLLKPALSRGELHCIGATTLDEYQKYILGDAALDRRFRSVPVNEPSIEDAVEILIGIKEKFEIHHGIKISEEAIYNSVLLSDKYITDKFLPDKAIDLIDESASALKLSAESMPAHLVQLESEIRSKKIYAQLDKKNKDITKEIEDLNGKYLEEKAVWENEVLALKKVTEVKNNLERSKFELEQAEREQNYELASKLKYSIIPELEGQIDSQENNWVLSTKDIADVISRQTGIPVDKILRSKQDHILQLENNLKARVFGQDKSLLEISETLISSHAGLKDESKPLGSFLLKGPSGVGKTETAKAVCDFLFDSQKNLIRIDMSEYSEKHSVSKLIGSPAGYVGYENGGALTEAVRRKPYSLILFDEIEKAHPDFADILLQILDDGRLTDNHGRTIDFKNTVIFLTTNSQNVEQDFKPEVLGRLDSILSYESLNESTMKNLVEKQINLLNQRLASKNTSVELDQEIINKLCTQGYSPDYGARPLHNIFNKLVIRPLSKMLVSGDLSEGKLFLELKDGEVKICEI